MGGSGEGTPAAVRGDQAQVDTDGCSRALLGDRLGEGRNIRVSEWIGDDQEQIDVAAAGEVAAERQGAVQDHRGEGLVERPRRC